MKLINATSFDYFHILSSNPQVAKFDFARSSNRISNRSSRVTINASDKNQSYVSIDGVPSGGEGECSSISGL